MTFNVNDDFDRNRAADVLEEEPNYPVAFGITFTPQVSGIAFAVLGLLGAAFILLNFVQPVYDSYKTLKEEEASKQEKASTQKSGAINQQLAEAEARLRQSELLRSQVLRQFSTTKSLQTLLYDIAQRAKARGVTLNSYSPQGDLAVVNDSSFGDTVNNKLKRQTFSLEIEGSYGQIHAFIEDLEKLQPLLIVSGLKMAFDRASFTVNLANVKRLEGNVVSKAKIVPTQSETIKASFNLEAILPLSREELAKISQSEQKGEEKGKQKGKQKDKNGDKQKPSPPPENQQPPEKK